MATGTEGTSTAAGTFTLGDEVASLLGDFVPDPELPVIEDVSDAGAPPAEPFASASDPAPGSEGTEPDPTSAGAPPAAATPAAPDAAVADDPLEGAQPLTYTVDGQDRAEEWIHVLKGGGAIIDAEHLPKLQQRLSERAHLYEQGQQSYQRYRDLERATTWQTRDAQGNVKDLTGIAALTEQRSVLARSLATLTVLNQTLADPAQAAKLVDFRQDGEGNVYVVWNDDAMDNLRTRAALAATQHDTTARAHLASLTAPPPAPESPIAEVAASTIEKVAQQAQVANLTAEDKSALAEQLERYVRPTTAEEKAQGHGSRIVDAAFTKLVQQFSHLRASSATSAQAATVAAQENARRLAAAAQGRRQASSPSSLSSTSPANRAAPTPQRPPTPATPVSQDQLWDMMERAAAGH